ncbi:hypothetical protein D3C78_1806590 [compost metagenome]
MELYSSEKYVANKLPNALSNMAAKLMEIGAVKDFDDSLVVADFVLNDLYPSIARYIRNLGYHAARIVTGTIKLTGANRKIYCNVLMMAV